VRGVESEKDRGREGEKEKGWGGRKNESERENVGELQSVCRKERRRIVMKEVVP
jgi:hypothetical protein